MTRALRVTVWTLLGAGVVLCTRTLVYSLAPTQTTVIRELEHRGGGPRLAILVATVVALGLLLAAGALWFAATAVRERLALEPRALVAAPRLRLRRLALRALLLFAATVPAFAYVESYLHWRAGLGWHGLSCAFGPLHRDAIPILGTLSVLAVALHGAAEHLLAWARRLVAALAARPRVLVPRAAFAPSVDAPRLRRIVAASEPRGPPPAFVPGL